MARNDAPCEDPWAEQYQEWIYRKAAGYLSRLMEDIRLPAWVGETDARDELERFLFRPILAWYRGESRAETPWEAYIGRSGHARGHFWQWAFSRRIRLRADCSEVDAAVEDPTCMALPSDAPETISDYARLRSAGFCVAQARRFLGLTQRQALKLEKWTRRWLDGTYDDGECRRDLAHRARGRPRKGEILKNEKGTPPP